LDDVFRGELHAGALLVEALVELPREGAHTAMDVVNWRAEPGARHGGKHRVAPDPVQHRHRAWLDDAAARLETAALHELVSFAEFGQEAGYLGEVIAVVCIAHEDVPSPRRGNAAHQGTAVALFCDRDDACAETRGDVL